jgi:outer membrane protein insertion porin family
VGYAEVSQENFDLFHPPYFTGGGQKIRLRVQLGTQRQDYELSFVEPWFLNRKLSLGVDLYRHELDFESPNDIYNETLTGAKVSLTRALGSDFLIGSVSATVEDVGINLNSGWHNANGSQERNVPYAILAQVGDNLYERIGGSIAYDTRNSIQLPNHGQRTQLTAEFSTGASSYYKLEGTTSWYFPGFRPGHVLELGGRMGTAGSLSGGDVPFEDRYYLGGLYSLRGFKYRNVAPRERAYPLTAPNVPDEPIGGDTYWFSSAEYSIPIFEQEGGVGLRFAVFYDIGQVAVSPWSLNTGSIDSNTGMGIRLNIPHLGPLRLDYGIPVTTDKFNGTSGKFQFGVGWSRPF